MPVLNNKNFLFRFDATDILQATMTKKKSTNPPYANLSAILFRLRPPS